MVNVDAIIRTQRKSIAISITPDGNVVVRIPKSCPMSYVERIIAQKENWILQHQQKIKQRNSLNSNLFQYKEVLFCGNVIPIVFSNDIKKAIIYNDKLFMPITIKQEKIKSTIEKLLRKYALAIIQNRVEYFASLMNLQPNSLKLNNAKKNWGSCSKTGIIAINWRCVMLPANLLDYVVVHELSHMLEFNHSKQFWAIVQSILPDMRLRKQNIKQGSYLLQLFRN